MGNLKAAFAKVNITPEEVTPLAGYDPVCNIADPQQDILDDLFARIVVMETDTARVVIVSTDSAFTNEAPVRVPLDGIDEGRGFTNTFPEGTKDAWARAAGTTAAHVSVYATHTHSAPAHFSAKYTMRIEEAIRNLLPRLQPVHLKIATGTCSISAFRRPNLQPRYDVDIDRTLQVLAFFNVQDELIGSLVAYAVHPTGLRNPSDPVARHRRVSAEAVGLAMSAWEKEQGGGFVSLFLQGFSGDICPVHGHNGEREDTYPLIQEMGNALFTDIKKLLNGTRAVSGYPLQAVQRTIQLPTRAGSIRPTRDVVLMAVKIGEVILFSASLEVFNGFVGKIKSHFPKRDIVLSGLANGYSGYLPTIEAFHDGLGGYEMGTTPYSEECDSIFVQESVRLLSPFIEGGEDVGKSR